MTNLVIFLIGLAIMLVLMMKTKLGAFNCMLIASVGIGIACNLGASTAINTTVDGFASTCKSIGLLVIFGTMLGTYLEKSNACQRIAAKMLSLSKKDNSIVALAATGYLVAIPVFSDVAMVLLSPLVKSVAKKSGKNSCMLSTVTACSLLSTNAFVAPTPAPLAVIAILGLDIGTSILWGLPCALFITICVCLWAKFYLSRKPDSWYVQLESEKEKVIRDDISEAEMPSFTRAIIPILLPIVLILASSVCDAFFPDDNALLPLVNFLGNKNIALALGVVSSVLCLGKFLPEKERWTPMNDSLKVAGPIVFITAAGGALAKIVSATGVGDTLATLMANSPIPVLLIPCLITGLSKFAQGSGSVAATMAAGLTVPLCEAGLITPLEAFLSISAGSSLGSHVNNSFFWVFSEFSGYDAKTTLKTLCVGQNVIMTLSGMIATFVVSLIV